LASSCERSSKRRSAQKKSEGSAPKSVSTVLATPAPTPHREKPRSTSQETGMTFLSIAARIGRSPVPRRWIVVAAATFGMLAAFGMATTIAVFMKPFEDEFGWPRADISFAYALLSAGAALGGLVVGWAFDRIDTRIIVVSGAVVMAAGLAALSWSDDLATIQRIYLAIGVAGFSCLYTPLIAVVGLWFDRGRGLAMGIATAGGTIGQGLTPLVVQPLIAAFGWRDAYLLLGIGFFVLLVPVMLLVTKPPTDGGTAAAIAAPESAPWPLPVGFSIAWLGLAAVFCRSRRSRTRRSTSTRPPTRSSPRASSSASSRRSRSRPVTRTSSTRCWSRCSRASRSRTTPT
jgi:MFS family permease